MRSDISHFSARILGDWLADIHRQELDAPGRYAWPFERGWQSDWQQTYQKCYVKLPSFDPDSLEGKVVTHSLAMRSVNETVVKQPFQQLVDSSKNQSLMPVFQIELILQAYHNKNYQGLVELFERLLTSSDDLKSADPRSVSLAIELYAYSLVSTKRANLNQQFEEIADHLEKAVSTLQESGFLLEPSSLSKALGCAFCFKGDLDKATSYMDQAAWSQGLETDVLRPIKTVLDMPKFLQDFDNPNVVQTVTDWYASISISEVEFRHQEKDEIVILVSADQRYFDWFAEGFAEVIGITNTGQLIHYHLVDIPLSPTLMQTFDTWERRYSVRINVTSETNELLNRDQSLVRGISANARFTYLPRYKEAYPKLLMTDIDGWFDNDVNLMVGNMLNDVCITSLAWRNHQKGWRFPWACINASPMYFSDTAASENAGNAISFYIKYLYWRSCQNGRLDFDLFWADQSGTFLVLWYMFRQERLDVGLLDSASFGQGYPDQSETRIEARQQKRSQLIDRLRVERGYTG